MTRIVCCRRHVGCDGPQWMRSVRNSSCSSQLCFFVSAHLTRSVVGCTGKSTLLNTLACRLDVNTTVRGEMRLNGRPYAATELKKMSGYVMQDDLLNANLTVRETLHYTAALRLPAGMDRKERDARVEEVIQEMGLVGCQNVIVGDPSKKGISGGERRRVCIGMELLTRPTLLFLDEVSLQECL